MMTKELGFTDAQKPPADSNLLVCCLLSNPGWVSAKRVRKLTGMSTREVRSAAEASKGEVLSGPGSPGYMLTRDASPEDMRYALNLESQAKRMLKRSILIRRRWHEGCKD